MYPMLSRGSDVLAKVSNFLSNLPLSFTICRWYDYYLDNEFNHHFSFIQDARNETVLSLCSLTLNLTLTDIVLIHLTDSHFHFSLIQDARNETVLSLCAEYGYDWVVPAFEASGAESKLFDSGHIAKVRQQSIVMISLTMTHLL